MMLDRTQEPEIKPIAEVQLQKPRRYSLSNGIPVFIVDNENLDLIHFIFQLNVGILHEKQKHIALFTYALLKQSSKDYSSTEVADLLDYYGAHFTVSETLGGTKFTLSVPKANVTRVLPIIYDFMAEPLYKEDNLQVYKNLKIKDLEYSSKKSDVRNTQLMLHAMFGDAHTAGQFSTRDNLNAITIPQMQTFHAQTFCAENMAIYMAGNLDAELEHCVGELFQKMPRGVAMVTPLNLQLPADTTPVISEEIPGSVQSSITLCQASMGYLDADRKDFSILSTITGGYFGSRLMQNLREKNGYTYGISSGSVYFGNQSLFIISSDVNVDDTRAAVDACFFELERLQQERVPEEELDAVRSYMIGDQLRDVENAVSYLKKFAYWNQFGLDESEFQTLIQRIRTISSEDIQCLAKKYFDYNKFTQVIVGGKL